jgi:hypothetical protein
MNDSEDDEIDFIDAIRAPKTSHVQDKNKLSTGTRRSRLSQEIQGHKRIFQSSLRSHKR